MTVLESPPDDRSNSRLPAQDAVGFVGLGRMGTAMAANLAAAGRRVVGYVRRADQIGKLAAVGAGVCGAGYERGPPLAVPRLQLPPASFSQLYLP